MKHWYTSTKTKANNEVNEFIKKNSSRLEVIIICFAVVYRELLNPNETYSMKNLMHIIEGIDHQLTFNMINFVDIKDIAEAHILDMNVLDLGNII